MAEVLRLEILVDDKGTPVLRQFASALDTTGQHAAGAAAPITNLQQATTTLGAATAQTGQGLQTLSGHLRLGASETSGFSAQVRALIPLGATMLAGFAGFTVLGSLFRSAAESAGAFQQSMANVNTLGMQSAQVQQQLREQLLALPPALSSSTELARGLYQVLSAGVEPANAVAFLADAARLAKAGLADLDTATIALTKTMAAFHLPTSQAVQISDILFKAVEVGQGTLQQFAAALPQVTQLAGAMGLTFSDTAATMATLSQTFRSVDTAATGFRSLLAQLLQNSDEFLALGINIKRVLSEEGMLGALRALQQVTGGNSERMRLFVNDIEGLQAALALTGPQFQTLIANQQKMGEATGSVARAVAEQTKTAGEAWKEFTNTLDRLVQQTAPPFLAVFTEGIHLLSGFVRGVGEGVTALSKFAAAASTISVADFTKQVADWNAQLQALQQQAPLTAEALAASFEKLKAGDVSAFWRKQVESLEALQRQAEHLSLFGKNTEIYRTITQQLTEAQAQLALQTQQTTTVQIMQNTELTKAIETLSGFNKALANIKKSGEIGQIIPADLIQKQVQTVIDSLGQLALSSQMSSQQMELAFTQAADTIRTRFGTDSPAFQVIETMLTSWRERTEAATGIVSKAVADAAVLQATAFAHIKEAASASAQSALDAAQAQLAAVQSGTEAQRAAAQAAVDTAAAVVQSAKQEQLAAEAVVLAKQHIAIAADTQLTQTQRATALLVNAAKQEQNAAAQTALVQQQNTKAYLEAAATKERAAQRGLVLVKSEEAIQDAAVQAAQQVVRAAQSRLAAALAASQGIMTANAQSAAADLEAAKQALFSAVQKGLAAQRTALAYEAIRIAASTTGTVEEREAALAVNAAKQAALAAEQRANAVSEATRREIQARAEQEASLAKGIKKMDESTESLSRNISKMQNLSSGIPGMAGQVGLLMASTATAFEPLGTTMAELQRQYEAIHQALISLTQSQSHPGGFWQSQNNLAEKYVQILGLINDKMVQLAKNQDVAIQWLTGFDTAMETHSVTIQASLTVLGEHTREFYLASVEAAQKAFAHINDGSQHMAEVWINRVLPAMQAAYGKYSSQVISATLSMVSSITGALAFLGVKTDEELKRDAEIAQQAFETIKNSGLVSAERLREIWLKNVLPKLEDAFGHLSQKAIETFEAISRSVEETKDAIQGLEDASKGIGFGLPPSSGAPPTAPPGSFQFGTDYVPQTGLALLHQGERVLPRAVAQGPPPSMPGRDIAGPISVTFGQITVQVQGGTGGLAPEKLGRALEEGIDKAIREGRFTYQLKRILGL